MAKYTYGSTLTAFELAKANDVATEFQAVQTASGLEEVRVDDAIKFPAGEGNDIRIVENAGQRAFKVLTFDASGDLVVLSIGDAGVIVDAGDLPITDAGGYYTGADVEAALQEISQSVKDTSGNNIVEYGENANAVNNFKITNSATGSWPHISTSGEADIGMGFSNSENEAMLSLRSIPSSVNSILIQPATTGNRPTITTLGEADIGMSFENSEFEELLELVATPTAVNNVVITNAATGDYPVIKAAGEANIGLDFRDSNNNLFLFLTAIAGVAANRIDITPATAGNPPIVAVTGSDANIDLSLAGKGTGGVTIAQDKLKIGATAITKTAAQINAVPNFKVIDIGDWDMDAIQTVNIAHELTYSKIRTVTASIRNDADSLGLDFNVWTEGQSISRSISWNSTNVNLSRATGSIFDSVNYDTATAFNRGWITIQYTD